MIRGKQPHSVQDIPRFLQNLWRNFLHCSAKWICACIWGVRRPVKPGRMKALSSQRTPQSLRDGVWKRNEKPGNVLHSVGL